MQHVDFGVRLATCLGLDESVSILLSGEFACDAIITRAQQLARQEVSTGTAHESTHMHTHLLPALVTPAFLLPDPGLAREAGNGAQAAAKAQGQQAGFGQ